MTPEEYAAMMRRNHLNLLYTFGAMCGFTLAGAYLLDRLMSGQRREPKNR